MAGNGVLGEAWMEEDLLPRQRGSVTRSHDVKPEAEEPVARGFDVEAILAACKRWVPAIGT